MYMLCEGSKTKPGDTGASSTQNQLRKPGVAAAITGKRDLSSNLGSNLLAKKPRLQLGGYTQLGRSTDGERRGSPSVQTYLFEENAKEGTV